MRLSGSQAERHGRRAAQRPGHGTTCQAGGGGPSWGAAAMPSAGLSAHGEARLASCGSREDCRRCPAPRPAPGCRRAADSYRPVTGWPQTALRVPASERTYCALRGAISLAGQPPGQNAPDKTADGARGHGGRSRRPWPLGAACALAGRLCGSPGPQPLGRPAAPRSTTNGHAARHPGHWRGALARTAGARPRAARGRRPPARGPHRARTTLVGGRTGGAHSQPAHNGAPAPDTPTPDAQRPGARAVRAAEPCRHDVSLRATKLCLWPPSDRHGERARQQQTAPAGTLEQRRQTHRRSRTRTDENRPISVGNFILRKAIAAGTQESNARQPQPGRRPDDPERWAAQAPGRSAGTPRRGAMCAGQTPEGLG